jgi:uncharacterized protein (DUF488 family)
VAKTTKSVRKRAAKASTAVVQADELPGKSAQRLWTIGHSTREIGEFLRLLAAGEIELLADVRRFPGSRRYPHFNQEALSETLATAGIDYRHLPGLGGRRSQRLPDSPNDAWRVKSFNAYADHLQSAEFAADFDQLMDLARRKRTAIMCSEALPHRCHRRIISDVLVARGWQVLHLLSPKRIELHQLTAFARVDGTQVTYPQTPLFNP